MKFLKTSVLLSFLILGNSDGFCVIRPQGADDAAYIDAAKKYPAACQIIKVSEDNSQKTLENYSGILIQDKTNKAILTAAHVFSLDKKGTWHAIFGEQKHEIVDFIIHPFYEHKNLNFDFAVGFLRTYPQNINSLLLGDYNIKDSEQKTVVSVIGHGENGTFDISGNVKYGSHDDARRLYKTCIQSSYFTAPDDKIACLVKASSESSTPLYGLSTFGDSGAPALDENGHVIAIASVLTSKKFIQIRRYFLEPDCKLSLFFSFFNFPNAPQKVIPLRYTTDPNRQCFAPITPMVRNWIHLEMEKQLLHGDGKISSSRAVKR